MISATSRASRSGTVFAAVISCSSAASARPGSPSGTLATPSANSSSMLSKLPCPFIGAQSPLSTTSRAFIEASSLFSDVSPIPLADFALDVGMRGGKGWERQDGAGTERARSTSRIASRAFAKRPCCRYS